MSKNVLITAGASGIGKAIAEAFEKNGDSIWIVDSDGAVSYTHLRAHET